MDHKIMKKNALMMWDHDQWALNCEKVCKIELAQKEIENLAPGYQNIQIYIEKGTKY